MAVNCLVDVRSWPERTDVLVVDPKQAVALAHFPLDPLCDGPLWDPSASYELRAQAALDILADDGEYLQASFHSGGEAVDLSLDLSGRDRIEEILAPAGLSLDQIDFDKLEAVEEKLLQLDLETLFSLVCDWHDVVERRYSKGSSLADKTSWAARSLPDDCYLYHYLVGDNSSDQEAYDLLAELNDVDLSDFSFGYLLRWVYYSRAEFAGLSYRSLKRYRD